MPRSARIAIIAGQLGVGGSERQLYLWLANMDRRRFEPMVVTLRPGGAEYWEDKIRALGVPLLREPHTGNPIRRLAGLVALVRPWRPALIHGWNLFTSPYAGALGWMFGAVSIGSLRSSPQSFRDQYWERVLTERLVDGIVVNSAWAARRLSTNGNGRRPAMFVVQNAIDTAPEPRERARPRIAERFGLSPDDIWIGAMSRMVQGKGLETVLDTFASVLHSMPRVRLVLIGDGPLRAALEARASALGVRDHVTFTGEDPDARAWLSALDISCFASADEGFPNVVLEAAAAAVPVVAWREPFVEEVLGNDAVDGLVPRGDVEQLTNVVGRLARDVTERRAIGERARRHVTDAFSVPRQVSRLTSVYDALLERRRGHAGAVSRLP